MNERKARKILGVRPKRKIYEMVKRRCQAPDRSYSTIRVSAERFDLKSLNWLLAKGAITMKVVERFSGSLMTRKNNGAPAGCKI